MSKENKKDNRSKKKPSPDSQINLITSIINLIIAILNTIAIMKFKS